MADRQFYTEYPNTTPLADVKYIGPLMAEQLANSVYNGQPRPIETLGDLRTFVMTRTGPNARRRIKEWLEQTLQNERPEECVGKVRKPYQTYDGRDHLYEVRPTNRNAFDALVAWLRANVPEGHRNKVPASKRDRLQTAFPPACEI